MFIENFLFVFSIIMLSAGFIFSITNDLIEGKKLGAKHFKRIIILGIISLLVLIYLKK